MLNGSLLCQMSNFFMLNGSLLCQMGNFFYFERVIIILVVAGWAISWFAVS